MEREPEIRLHLYARVLKPGAIGLLARDISAPIGDLADWAHKRPGCREPTLDLLEKLTDYFHARHAKNDCENDLLYSAYKDRPQQTINRFRPSSSPGCGCAAKATVRRHSVCPAAH